MSVFSQAEKETRKAPAMVLVPPNAFAPTWRDRPEEPVLVGLRPLSEQDQIFCNGEAVKEAFRFYPGHLDEGVAEAREAAYHDLQMRLAISRGTCDPNDVLKPWEYWGRHGGDELVRTALTTEGVKFLWDQIERVTIETSPVEPQATDEDIQELLTKAPVALAAMPQWRAARARRLLHFCFNEVLAALNEPTDG